MDDGKVDPWWVAELAAGGHTSYVYTSLRHHGDDDGDARFFDFCAALAVNRVIKTVVIMDSACSVARVRALADVLTAGGALETLDLTDCDIGNEGAQVLAKVLTEKIQTLKELHLASSNIGVEGVQALAGALHLNAMLTHLDVSGNEIGTAGAQALVFALERNPKLVHVDFQVSVNDSRLYLLAMRYLARNERRSGKFAMCRCAPDHPN